MFPKEENRSALKSLTLPWEARKNLPCSPTSHRSPHGEGFVGSLSTMRTKSNEHPPHFSKSVSRLRRPGGGGTGGWIECEGVERRPPTPWRCRMKIRARIREHSVNEVDSRRCRYAIPRANSEAAPSRAHRGEGGMPSLPPWSLTRPVELLRASHSCQIKILRTGLNQPYPLRT